MVFNTSKLKEDIKELKNEINSLKEEMYSLKYTVKELSETYDNLLDLYSKHVSAYYHFADKIFGIVLLDTKNKIVIIDKDKMFKGWTVYYVSEKDEHKSKG